MVDLDFFFPDVVSIETSKGESAMGLRAQFSKPGEVVLRGDDTIISEGEVVIRKLKNGLTERYEIINVEYQQGFEELPAVTNLAVRKQGSDFSPRGTSVKNVYNLHGANARVNVGSHDYSVNTVNVASAKVFANLKTALLTNVQDEALKVQLVELVEHLQLSQGSKSFTAKFQEFMALAANCMTVVAPFVPALTQFLR